MFNLCHKRHARSGIAEILLQATDKGIKGGGVGRGTRCTERSRVMSSGVAPHVFFDHFDILSPLGIDLLDNRRRF